MSLIRVRNERKKDWVDIRRGKSPRMLIFLLILVGIAIWYIGQQF
jgi:hypothetical protein